LDEALLAEAPRRNEHAPALRALGTHDLAAVAQLLQEAAARDACRPAVGHVDPAFDLDLGLDLLLSHLAPPNRSQTSRPMTMVALYWYMPPHALHTAVSTSRETW